MLADLCGKPVLAHVVERVQSVCEDVVVAVPHGEARYFHKHEWPEEWAERTPMMWEAPGEIETEDVLGRFVACIDDVMPTATYVIRVCGDNPLLDTGCLRTLVAACEEQGPDYVAYRFRDGCPAITRPTGYFAEAVWVTALRAINRQYEQNHRWREHVTAGLYEEEGHTVDWIPVPLWYYERMTPKFTAIDTPEDLERVRRYVTMPGWQTRT
jgi:spore coat polysaccharide biosynthesis protein SpsF (cytidylyltransferase family)